MSELHDERRIPLDYAPALTPSELGHLKTMTGLGIARRNRQDAARAQAVEANDAERLLDAKRKLRQPGLTPEAMDMAMRVLARVGGGS